MKKLLIIFLILLIPIGLVVNANAILVVEGTNIILAQTGLDEILASTKVRGYDGTNFGEMVGGMFLKAGQAFTSSAQGVYIVFQTTPLNSIIPVDVFKINMDGSIGINQTKLCLDALDCSGNDYIISNSNGNNTIYSAGNKIQIPNSTGTLALVNGGSGFNNIASVSTSVNATIISDNSTVTNRATFKTISAGTDMQVINGSQSIILNAVMSKIANVLDVANGCGNGQILEYQSSNSTWICANDDSGGGTARESEVAVWTVDSTKTNIGTAYVNVYTTGLGDPLRIDTNGKTTATLIIDWTKVGAGTQKCQIVSNTSGAIVLITFNNLVSGLNTNATVTIPTNAQNLIDVYKPQCFSTTGTDDPLWLSGQVLLR